MSFLLGKVSPTAWLEDLRAGGGVEPYLRSVGPRAKDAADARNRNAGNAARDARGGRGGEEEFVRLAAVERLVESGAGEDGQRGRVDFGSDAGGLAKMREVGGEAVAEVDRGGGCGSPRQPEALRDARLRIEVRS